MLWGLWKMTFLSSGSMIFLIIITLLLQKKKNMLRSVLATWHQLMAKFIFLLDFFPCWRILSQSNWLIQHIMGILICSHHASCIFFLFFHFLFIPLHFSKPLPPRSNSGFLSSVKWPSLLLIQHHVSQASLEKQQQQDIHRYIERDLLWGTGSCDYKDVGSLQSTIYKLESQWWSSSPNPKTCQPKELIVKVQFWIWRPKTQRCQCLRAGEDGCPGSSRDKIHSSSNPLVYSSSQWIGWYPTTLMMEIFTQSTNSNAKNF